MTDAADRMAAALERIANSLDALMLRLAAPAQPAAAPQQPRPVAQPQPQQAAQPVANGAQAAGAPLPPVRNASANGRQAFCDCPCQCYRNYGMGLVPTGCCQCLSERYQNPCGCRGRADELLTQDANGRWRWMPAAGQPPPQAEPAYAAPAPPAPPQPPPEPDDLPF